MEPCYNVELILHVHVCTLLFYFYYYYLFFISQVWEWRVFTELVLHLVTLTNLKKNSIKVLCLVTSLICHVMSSMCHGRHQCVMDVINMSCDITAFFCVMFCVWLLAWITFYVMWLIMWHHYLHDHVICRCYWYQCSQFPLVWCSHVFRSF